MSFWVAPPDINSARIYTGPGAAPMLDAATAWDTLSNALYSTATEATAVTANVPWSGPSADAMRTAWTRQQAWLLAAATQAERTAQQARAAAAAYTTARDGSVPPSVVAANRAQTAALIAANILGHNSAAIAALETEYAQMWAQDITAMAAYQAAAQAAAAGLPTLGGTVTETSPEIILGDILDSSALFVEAPIELLDALAFLFVAPVAQTVLAPLWAPPITVPPAPPAASPLPVRPMVRVRVGVGVRRGLLRVPPSWAQPPRTTPDIPAQPQPERGAPPPVVAPLPIPLPIGVSRSGTPAKKERPQPEYGATTRFVPRPPAGG